MLIRSAVRSLLRHPSFSALVILTLAVGIGTTTAMFAVVHTVFLRPLPFPDEDRLVTIWETDVQQGIGERRVTPANFVDWAARATTIEALGTLPNWSGPAWTFKIAGRDGSLERVRGVYASSGFFKVLGIAPLHGRTFGSDEDTRSGERRVVISHDFWLARFAGHPSVVGRTIDVDTFGGGAFTVIGVMPQGFAFPRDAAIWLSLGDWGGGPMPARDAAARCCSWYTTLARLKPGVTKEQAGLELTGIAKEISERHPDGARVTSVKVIQLRETLVGDQRMAVLGLFGAVGCVLLIGCANVASLLLSRGVSRRREILTRLALGATRWRIARLLLVESAALTLCGGLAGLLIAEWTRGLLLGSLLERIPMVEGLRLGLPAIAFWAGTTAAAGLFCAVAPLIEWRGVTWQGRGQTESRSGRRVRHALVIGEIAVAVALIATAGLLVRTVTNLRGVALGFAVDRTLVVSTDLTSGPLRSRGTAASLLEQALPRLAALPGVRAVAAATNTPLEGGPATGAITREGDTVRVAAQSPQVRQSSVTPGYFALIGQRLLRGRVFTELDSATGVMVAVINETAARRYWPGEDPVGKRFTIGSLERFGFFRPPPTPGGIEWREIVGIVSDVRSAGFAFDVQAEVYYNYKQSPLYDPAILVRTAADPASLAPAVRETIQSANRAAVITEVRTLEDVASASIAEPRLRARLVTMFSLFALGLGMVGIYGLMAYSVAQQVREIGIRIALGAQPAQIARLVLAKALALTLAGVAIGVAIAGAVGQWASTMLFGVTPFDPATFAGTCALLACAALAASYVPARRALQVDPVVALQSE